MSKPLTDRLFWRDYWKDYRPGSDPSEVFFASLLGDFPTPPATFLEIGGFPGRNSAYVAKRLGLHTTLLDFEIAPPVVREVESRHGLSPGTLRCLEGDLFRLVPPASEENKFDVVFSAGFIEHFIDIDPVLDRHLDYLKQDGRLLVTVPNLRGISGWFMRWAEPANFAHHSLAAMDPKTLRHWAETRGLREIEVRYFGSPHVWIDHPEKTSRLRRLAARAILAVLTRLPTWTLPPGRAFSPYLMLKGTRR